MTLIALIIGAILVVAAIRNSQGALFTALATDVPGFVVWAAAIVALGVIGFVPGLKPVSRALLGLIIVVIILRDYQPIIAGFQNAWQNAPASSSTTAAAPNSTSSINTATTTAPSTGAATSDVTAPPLTIPAIGSLSDDANAFGGGD